MTMRDLTHVVRPASFRKRIYHGGAMSLCLRGATIRDTPFDLLATMFWPTMLRLGIPIRPLIEHALDADIRIRRRRAAEFLDLPRRRWFRAKPRDRRLRGGGSP